VGAGKQVEIETDAARTHANSRSPLRSPRAIYREHFADARRERLFLSSVAFFLTFAIAPEPPPHKLQAGVGGEAGPFIPQRQLPVDSCPQFRF